ncbi:DUF3054 domain-containing protein [Microbacterium sp. B19]|uniref:DUF3054 domain-containing protein n=1 Tax=Microbacterium sp. B19 TaxID=96765 RepID=UPI00034C9F81|nr:DUF3054 domain-containing protein [Microbacterium sp. B19]
MTIRRAAVLALLLDVVLVVVFAAIGRATHDGDILGPGGSGLATTAWPFLAGLLIGWIVSRGWRRPAAPLRTGLPVWAVTLVAGMLLRALSGQGVALAFVIVAGITLLLFLVGWRAIAALVARVRVSRSA